jgi:hypothetical protein
MHPQDVATGSIEPGEKHDLVPWPDAIKRVEDVGLADEPRRRGALVTASSAVRLPWMSETIASRI